ncbi:pyridoxal-phosphate dependent enzyme [Amycolatopsis cynarae]|uniref:Pyridoxal-phosphate dependent enzyme n=1 Tax=Amycolatopsis cynarae TaxID=2995223 RepID=A0ABY7BA01_9PSEU|nr:pyridoxal-phosphate dependent enzyme [Amycolatopsis sp. HUAS 11-8]WAL69190.1 pyridoxal-phosphate dependent enzyme [Amycolatopsis sp. HUAS 11-8]
MLSLPTMTDVLRARRLLATELTPTPLRACPALGPGVLIKHENLHPTGAFKVRGGLNLLAGLDGPGVVGYSTGNHAQSLAHAAARYGMPCTIVMPERPNPAKAAAVRALGAELVEYGATFDDAREHAQRLAKDRGLRLVSAADEPALIAGVATAYLEVFEADPDVEAIVVPVGGGSGAAAACLVAAAVAPGCEIFAVQSSASPAAHDSWRAGTPVHRPNETVVEGLATGSGFALTQELLRDRLADFLLVSDEEIARAQARLLREAHVLAEGAGAAPLAALDGYRDRFAGRKVVLMCTGGNASPAEIRAAATAEPRP